MRYGALVVAAVVAASVAAAASDELPAALLDAKADRVHARTDVPSQARKVGEVRLVERGAATVVQTLLATRAIERVVTEIRRKEWANWPPGAAGHDDMLDYARALLAATAELERAREGADDRRVRLAIELVATREAAGLALLTFDAGETDGRIEPRGRRTLASRPLGRAYVLRNMRLILADAFHVLDAEVDRLGPLGQAGSAPPPGP